MLSVVVPRTAAAKLCAARSQRIAARVSHVATRPVAWPPATRPAGIAGHGPAPLRATYGSSLDSSAVDAEPDAVQAPVQQEGRGNYAGVRAVVAGATGETGRLIVQRLSDEGVPVRAIVRDDSKAAKVLPRLSSVSTVMGDVYRYETLAAAIGNDSNVLFIATGARPVPGSLPDPLGPYRIDYTGTLNLIAAAKAANIKRIILVTSIGVENIFNPLNLFAGILVFKKLAEEALQRSGIEYTIVRPGGLKSIEPTGGILMAGRNAFGGGSISRKQVADVCVEALICPGAKNKVVEIVARPEEPKRQMSELFASVP